VNARISRGQVNGVGEQVVPTAWRDHRAFAIDLAFRMLGDVDESEDVVQEARFLRLTLRCQPGPCEAK
jgi:DNA-directed RNA polymerase specialized sigma24 family protein